MPSHHPDPEELLAYATGTSEPWLSALMACHLTLCPACRRELEVLEELGGALLDEYPGDLCAAVDANTKLNGVPAAEPHRPPPAVPAEIASRVPRPLHPYFAEQTPRFRWLAPGVEHIPLTLQGGGRPVRLVQFKPGFVIPEHAHGGLEWLMVLRGALTDQATGDRYALGDVSRRDKQDVHVQLVHRNEPCLAVFAHIGPPIPKSVVGRVLAKIAGL